MELYVVVCSFSDPPTSPVCPPTPISLSPVTKRSCSSTLRVLVIIFFCLFFFYFELQYRFLHLAFLLSFSCKINQLFHLDLSGSIVQPSRHPLEGASHMTWFLLLLEEAKHLNGRRSPCTHLLSGQVLSIRLSERCSGHGDSRLRILPLSLSPSDKRSSLSESLWCCWKKKLNKWTKKKGNDLKEGVIPNNHPSWHVNGTRLFGLADGSDQ